MLQFPDTFLRHIISFVFAVMIASIMVPVAAQHRNKAVPVILDTDMGPDYDDVGALAMLHALADRGEARILATIASTRYDGVGSVLNILNTYFGRPTTPIAVPRGSALTLRDFQHWSDTLIARYPHTITQNTDTPDAVALYRQLLATQPDHSVTIISIGFLTNLGNLLRSSPDGYSSLDGKTLVAAKVKHLVSMAGKFPTGLEFNIEEDAASAKYALDEWPTPILFSGYEIGARIKTGLPLIGSKIEGSPVKDVYRISIPLAAEDSVGRMSWDQTAVLVAVRGYRPHYIVKRGRIRVHDDGSNSWDPVGKGHAYLVEKSNPMIVQRIINDLMMHTPVNLPKR